MPSAYGRRRGRAPPGIDAGRGGFGFRKTLAAIGAAVIAAAGVVALVEGVDDRAARGSDQRALADAEAGDQGSCDRAAGRADARAAQDVAGALCRCGRGEPERDHPGARHDQELVHVLILCPVPFQAAGRAAREPGVRMKTLQRG